MTEEELKEKIIARFRRICDLGRYPAELQVANIFDWFKQAGYVQLDPDQSLPETPQFDNCQLANVCCISLVSKYQLAQQDMLKANFKKVL